MHKKNQMGIIGGGQLSMMLLQKAQALGLLPSCLAPHQEDPAFRVSREVVMGDPRQEKDLKRFAESLSHFTFESEFYDAAFLKAALKEFKGHIFPSLKILSLLQDRKSQKEAFQQYRLQSSPFIFTTRAEDVRHFFKEQKSLVAKKRWNSYDGYGTSLLHTTADLEKFLQSNAQNLGDFIFEKLIAFEYEVAVQAARSRAGQVEFFPFVKTIQKENKCFIVEGPEKMTPQLLKLQKSIQSFLKKIDYVGVIGFEFFKTRNGYILNEVAPRVHNTGHHTLDSCNVDQFTMHWLCALQDKLPSVELKCKSFVMLNLIGESDSDVIRPDRQQGSLYWYGKSNRKGRKLGHINFVGEKKKALVRKAFQELKKWKL